MFAIGVTDIRWFQTLRTSPPLPEVNFWTPTPWGVTSIVPGSRFYFMLKSPIRKIGGSGEYVRYENMTALEAWERFGTGNGVSSSAELVYRVQGFAQKRSVGFAPEANPTIGCIVLRSLVYLDDDAMRTAEDADLEFSPQIVKFKTFAGSDTLAEKLGTGVNRNRDFSLVAGESKTTQRGVKDRKGASEFRRMVLEAYGGQCSMFGSCPLQVIEAAHIQPYIDETSNHLQNGLPLRVDAHRLFDAGLLTVTAEYRIQTSKALNGTPYADLDGRKIASPQSLDDRASQVALDFHRRFVFRANAS